MDIKTKLAKINSGEFGVWDSSKLKNKTSRRMNTQLFESGSVDYYTDGTTRTYPQHKRISSR